MDYQLIKDILKLAEDFENDLNKSSHKEYNVDIEGFRKWMIDTYPQKISSKKDVEWEGKLEGRSAESVLSTLIVHLNRFAKSYSKSAMIGSPFSTQDEFIYLINLNAFGKMTKTDLIKKNFEDKPTGIQIINRLIKNGWVKQKDSSIDKRSKLLEITSKGKKELQKQMPKIRQATKIVAGNLTQEEKLELIKLLNKLEDFHQKIFDTKKNSEELLDWVMHNYLQNSNK